MFFCPRILIKPIDLCGCDAYLLTNIVRLIQTNRRDALLLKDYSRVVSVALYVAQCDGSVNPNVSTSTVCHPSAKKTFLGQNKSFWGALELVEKLTPEAGEITASVKDLPGLRSVRYVHSLKKRSHNVGFS